MGHPGPFRVPRRISAAVLLVAAAALSASTLAAPGQTPIALVPVDAAKDGGVKVTGALEVSRGSAVIADTGSITAGNRTVTITLPGKGELRLCSTTTVHLSRDRSFATSATSLGASSAASGAPATASTGTAPATKNLDRAAIMIALDRGALEASYATGKYSDVLMTPDFRILISGPGFADLRIRVSPQGDTCLDNLGDHAPYVTVSSQLEEGLYRVQPNQRVLFEHGSLHEVVDHEPEPCGCPPPPLSVASIAANSAGVSSAKSGDAAGGASPQAADTTFPLAESEGLAPLPKPSQPTTAPGELHTQITTPLVYDGAAPAPLTPPPALITTQPARTPASSAASTSKPAPRGFFHGIGHFFSRLFGK